jgi:curved DNA-binding protein CbpA
MGSETYYEILGINENADDDVVKQAFRDLAKHYHPDRNPGDAEAERQFKRMNTAYEGLKDASRRQAYNEWLEFAQKRTKVKHTQWGRLAALVFLLLLGPSAVLYWAVVIADIPLFAESVDKVAASAPPKDNGLLPPSPEKREPAASSEPAAAAQQTASEPDPAQQPANPAPAASPLAQPAATNPATGGDHRAKADRALAASPAEPNRNAAQSSKEGGADIRARASKREAAGTEKTYTQALPEQTPQAEAPQAPPIETASAEDPPDKDRGSPVPAAETDEGQNARAAARMLARLKEPEGARAGGDLPGDGSASESAAPSQNGLSAHTFADCDECPPVSTAGSNAMFGGKDRAAVSLTEITLADWDGCVADRACPAYQGQQSGSRRDTIVEVGSREAESYAKWLSSISGKNYRPIISPHRRDAVAQRCNSTRRNGSGWEWLDDDAERACPPSPEQSPDGPRGFRVFRRVIP